MPSAEDLERHFNKSNECFQTGIIESKNEFPPEFTQAVIQRTSEYLAGLAPREAKFSITPTNDLVIIRKHSVEDLKSPSGILLPPVEDSADTPWKGTVLAVGPGKPAKLSGAGENVVEALKTLCKAFNVMPNPDSGSRGINLMHWQRAADALRAHESAVQRVPMQVKVGDIVVFSRNGHQTFQINGEVVFAMGEASILGIIEP